MVQLSPLLGAARSSDGATQSMDLSCSQSSGKRSSMTTGLPFSKKQWVVMPLQASSTAGRRGFRQTATPPPILKLPFSMSRLSQIHRNPSSTRQVPCSEDNKRTTTSQRPSCRAYRSQRPSCRAYRSQRPPCCSTLVVIRPSSRLLRNPQWPPKPDSTPQTGPCHNGCAQPAHLVPVQMAKEPAAAPPHRHRNRDPTV